MFTAIAVVVSLAVGFGIGRIKNAQKLERIQDAINKAEINVVQDAKLVIHAVRMHL